MMKKHADQFGSSPTYAFSSSSDLPIAFMADLQNGSFRKLFGPLEYTYSSTSVRTYWETKKRTIQEESPYI